ncbi:MAG TPA: MFS transporter [Acidocella sp.]|jgi:DHA2 family multidrug resistance protein-like MFS transporter|uniref:MFS transporter n=1 Tax=Acidocella sp. TaxID=50710 RepID=UPI002C4C12A5|nr:MFS transporter [Acidocella sp.]HVE21065.1 MFS transporter [Acidocella sp.]
MKDDSGSASGGDSLSHPAATRLVQVDGLAAPQRYWAFAAVMSTVTLATMDATIANVALPTISRDFRATPTDSIAIVSAYQLAMVVLLLPLSKLGEIFGYRRVYLSGIAIFTAASLACVLSHSIAMLTVARILQGVGAAGISSTNTALIRYIFPQANLGKGVGLNSMAVAIASTIGPSFAGIMLAFASWQWLFLINLPLGIVAFAIGWRNLPESDHAKQRFDIPSALLTAIAFGMLIVTIQSFSHPTGWPTRVAQIGVGCGALVWAVRRQLGLPAPLLPVDLLRRPVFGLSVGTSICSFTAQMLAFVSLPFFLERNLGLDVTTTGLLITPWPLSVAITAVISGRLADRYPASILNCLGLAAMMAGLVLLGFLPPHPGIVDIALRMALCGAGFGFFQPPNNRVILTAAPRTRSGAASGTISSARLLGQGTGAALAALLLAHAGAQGAVLSLFAGAGFAGLAAVLSLLRAV